MDTLENKEYLNELLGRLKKPSIFLGTPSIIRLNMLLTGYSLARLDLGLPVTTQEQEFSQFQEWVETKYQSKTTEGWDSIILKHSIDDRDAFNQFFNLYDEYKLTLS
jgi:succinylarginine dihydrolase